MFNKVLYPIDIQEGERSPALFTDALEAVRGWGAELYVLYVVPGASMPLVAAYLPPDAAARMREEATKRLDDFIARHIPQDIRAHPVLREGRPYEEILAAALDRGVDLIMLPSHERHGLERWLLGSTAAKVVHHAERSVLVLRDRPPA